MMRPEHQKSGVARSNLQPETCNRQPLVEPTPQATMNGSGPDG